MSQKFIAYIDEAGDEGFGKLKPDMQGGGQSHWLALGACIVSVENDIHVPQWRNEILEKLRKRQKNELHFRDLKHPQKTVACQVLSQKPLGICVVMSNKITLQSHPKKEIFKEKQHLYNYLVRYLLERLTHVCAEKSKNATPLPPSLKVVFSRREGTDYKKMREYLEFMKDGKELLPSVRSINWAVLDIPAIKVINHSKSAGLQIADVVTSAIYQGVEPNYFGNYEQSYSQILRPRLIKRQNSILDCGITPIPQLSKNILKSEQIKFFENFK